MLFLALTVILGDRMSNLTLFPQVVIRMIYLMGIIVVSPARQGEGAGRIN